MTSTSELKLANVYQGEELSEITRQLVQAVSYYPNESRHSVQRRRSAIRNLLSASNQHN
ncbi:hypothetical protein THOB06_40090 [Vibrio rotiferianus]|nr:hypothetical protein THOG10_40090 [Vibrio rotiferianus]CAH1588333.1 hypothetical protein THOB06_40090 [Vibrio rotiferianus]